MTSSIAGSTTAIDLEKQVRADRQLTERAFSNLAELEAARIHWLQRVEGARGFGATEHALAARLALLADKRVERGLEIIGSGADWGRKIGLKDGEAINLAIPKFQTSALVEVVVRGWGPRKWHLILLLTAQHWQEATSLAKDLINRQKANAV